MTQTNTKFTGPLFWAPVLLLSLLLFVGFSWMDSRPESTLQALASVGDTKLLSKCLADGARVNGLDENGRSPLHCAIVSEKNAAAEILLKAGADANQKTPEGNTPLHLAVEQGNQFLAEKLLSAGADPNRVNKKGVPPLYLAVEHNSPLVSTLLQFGAVPNDKDCPEGGYLFCAARSGCVTMLKELILRLEDINRLSQQEVSALHYAVYGGHVDTARLLLQHGANVNSRDGRGLTPLHRAARCGPAELIDLLVDQGADLEAKDDRGYTPLLIAGQVGSLANVSELVQCGADINAKNKEGKTIDDFALANHHTNIRTFLIEHRRELATRRTTPIVQI